MKKNLFSLFLWAAFTSLFLESCEKLPQPKPEPSTESDIDYRWTYAGKYNGPRAATLSVCENSDSLMCLYIRDYVSSREVTMHDDGTFTYDGEYANVITIYGRFYANNDSLYVFLKQPTGHIGSYIKEWNFFKVRAYYPTTK